MPKILLIFPDARGLFARMPYPVLYLAGYLKERGISVDIIDLRMQSIEDVPFEKYDYFGFSLQFTGPQINSALKTARFLRSEGVRVPFIWGGVHATIAAEETAENEFVDYVVRGEGEETLYQLIRALEEGVDAKNVEGIIFKKGAQIIKTPDRDFIDLEKIPTLQYDLLKNFREYSELKRTPSFVSIGTSRGCPFNCGFCYCDVMHKRRWRSMSADRVIVEIKNILNYFKPDAIMANDDYFFASLPRAKEIAQKIIDEKLNIKWSGSIRFDSAVRLTGDFWDLLKRSGFVNPNFGGESGSTEILNLINKKISLEQMENVVSCLNDYDFKVYANYMFGLPGEKYEDIIKTFNLIKKLSKKNKNFFSGVSIYTPYPGTPLYPLALESGFKPPRGLENWADYQYNSVENLPWLKSKARRLVRTVSLFTHFTFNQKINMDYSFPRKNIIFFLAFFVLTLSARIRWVLGFFIFPIEWRLYEYVCRLFKIQER